MPTDKGRGALAKDSKKINLVTKQVKQMIHSLYLMCFLFQFCLPHPGNKMTKGTWDGDSTKVGCHSTPASVDKKVYSAVSVFYPDVALLAVLLLWGVESCV